MSDSLIKEIHDSPYKGIINEVGIGLEFSASLLRVAGASKTVLSVHSDYAGLEKPKDLRAVSLDNAKRMATGVEWLVDDQFSIAITGVHYGPEDGHKTHAWIYIARPEGDAYMHVTFKTNPESRHVAATWLSDITTRFLHNVLLKKQTWLSFCQWLAAHHQLYVDVIYSPGIGDFERLAMLTHDKPLVYQDGKFQRVQDILRTHNVIYAGSFNPPHLDHETVSNIYPDNTVFVLATDYCDKGAVSFEDLYHRIKMLDMLGHPILLLYSCPMFWQKHETLNTIVNQQYTYIMGADTWNRLIIQHQYPTSTFLAEKMRGARFDIVDRDGIKINEYSPLNHGVVCAPPRVGYSSTDIRNGNNSGMRHEVLEYYSTNKLNGGISKI